MPSEPVGKFKSYSPNFVIGTLICYKMLKTFSALQMYTFMFIFTLTLHTVSNPMVKHGGGSIMLWGMVWIRTDSEGLNTNTTV